MKYLLSAIIGALICFLILNTCNKPVEKLDTHLQDSLYRVIDTLDSQRKSDSVAYERELQLDDSDRTEWLEAKEQTEQKLTNKIAQLSFSLAKYKAAQDGKDTVGQLVNCNEIVKELDSIYTQSLTYKAIIDSLQLNATERRGIDSSELNFLRQSIVQDGEIIDQLKKVLSDALVDNQDLRKQLVKSKKGKWILGVLGFLIGGFAGHELK